ncbi:hypothetical protein [Vibrio alginolyticus]|nr:hypothetical protein [Vibrio alginolyticus]
MTSEEIQETVQVIVALRPTPKVKAFISQERLIGIKNVKANKT